MSRMFCRQVVRAFGAHMLAKLYANDHKPGWRADDPRDLMDRLRQEVAELDAALKRACTQLEIPDQHGRWSRLVDGARFRFRLGPTISVDPHMLANVQSEAADVANFAMMIADRFEQMARRAVEAAE